MTESSMVDARVTHRYRADAARVYDAFFQADTARRWFFAGPTGQVVQIEIDGHEGGHFLVVDRRDGKDIAHYGTWLELARPARIVFDFSVMSPTENRTRVVIELTPLVDGTDVTLVHEGIPAEHAEKAKAGWARMLNGLGQALGE